MGIEFINDSFEPDRPGDQNKNQNGICNRDWQYFHAANGQQNEKPFIFFTNLAKYPLHSRFGSTNKYLSALAP